MSQIQTVPNVPYIADSNNEIDNLQYATLLTNTNDSYILQDSYQAIGVRSDGYPESYKHGPKIIDGPETQSLITDIFNDILDSTTYPAASSVEFFLLGGQQTVITYGTANLSSPHSSCGGMPPFIWSDPNGSNWPIYCEPNPPQLITFDPQTLSKPVMLDASIDVSSVSQSHPVTASLSAVVDIDINDPAFDIFTNLVTTPSTLSASRVNIEISYVKVIQNTNIPADATLRSTTDLVIPAINEALDKGDESLLQSEQTLEGVWNTGTGYWYSSQNASFPEFDYTLADQISAYNYNFDARAGQMALYRLNTIPVLSADRILTPVTDNTGSVTYEISLSSQVNLLEAVWTQWRYLQGITETVYGIPALTATADIFRDDPTATTLIPELTGFNVIEGLNTIYTNVSALSGDFGNLNPDLTLNPAFTALSAYSTECCETLTTDVSALSSELDNISARVATDFVNLTGDTMTGPLELARDPVLDMEAVPRGWLEDNFMPLSNVIPTITAVNKLKLLHSPVEPLDAVSKEYIDCKLYNFEQTFPRIPDLDLRYLNLSGDHMVGALHFSHDTDLDYGVIPSHVKNYDIDVSFDNKTFQTIRIYRTDVKHNIKLHDQGNGKVTSLRIINMADDRVHVTIPPNCRCLSTYYDYINEGYSGIISFTSFGTRDCDVYYAHAFECTPQKDKTCNEPVCQGGIGMVTFDIPQSTCTDMFTFSAHGQTYTVPVTSTDNYCFKIDDTASVTVDDNDYIQGIVNIEGTDIKIGQATPQPGDPPIDSMCTFIWDIEDVTGDQYKFYFGQENTYIDRIINGWEYRVTYLGLGSFMFNVSGVGPGIPAPTPAPPTYNIEFAFNQLSAVEVDEGRAAIVEVRRLESSETMGACSVDFFTSDDSATESVDYKKTTGTLHWRDDDYSTRIVTIPIYTDIDESEGVETFQLGLSGGNYTSQKTTVYGMPSITFTYPTPIDIDIEDIPITTLYKMVTGNTANIDTLSGDVDTNTANINTLSGDVDTNTANINTLSGDVDTNTANISILSAHH